MREVKSKIKAPKKAARIASHKDVIGESFAVLFREDYCVVPDNLYFLFSLKNAPEKSVRIDLHDGKLYLDDGEELTALAYEDFPAYLKNGGKGAGKYKHLSAKNWQRLTDRETAEALAARRNSAPVQRECPAEVTLPDVEAYYIRLFDGTNERSVYLRKIGGDAWRVFYTKAYGKRLAFDTYTCSEYSLHEIVCAKDRRSRSGQIDCCDRLLDADALKYLSAFMPDVHAAKRAKALPQAADDAGLYEVIAYYWKNEKSVPCADGDYVIDLFGALEEIALYSVELAAREEAQAPEAEPAQQAAEEEPAREEAPEDVDAAPSQEPAELIDTQTDERAQEKQPLEKKGFFARFSSAKKEKAAEPLSAQTPQAEDTAAEEPLPDKEEIPQPANMEQLAACIMQAQQEDVPTQADEAGERAEAREQKPETAEEAPAEEKEAPEAAEAPAEEEEAPEGAEVPAEQEEAPEAAEAPAEQEEALEAAEVPAEQEEASEAEEAPVEEEEAPEAAEEAPAAQEKNMPAMQGERKPPLSLMQNMMHGQTAQFDLAQLLSAFEVSGRKKAKIKDQICQKLPYCPFIVPISVQNYDDTQLVYISKKAHALCGDKIVPFVMMADMQALLPQEENMQLRKGVMVKTIVHKNKAYIPIFSDFQSARQICGVKEQFGIFTLQNLFGHIEKSEAIEGVILNPGVIGLRFSPADYGED